MANIKTTRKNGSLIINLLPSLDRPDEPAIVLNTGGTLRIHAPNGGYLYSLAVDRDGHITRFQDAGFHEGTRGMRLNERAEDI